MPTVELKTLEGQTVGEIDLPDGIFSVPYNPFPIQEVVRMQLANKRRGTHKVKDRSEVAGSVKKLYRQKGTGHARSGTRKSPLRRGGGTIFGPTPRSYGFSPPKKVRRLALKIALSKKLADGELDVVQEFSVDEPKTQPLLKKVDPEKTTQKVLLVYGEMDPNSENNLYKALRNVPYCKVLKADGLNVFDLLNYQRVILLKTSVQMISERLGK